MLSTAALGYAIYYRRQCQLPELIYQDNPNNRELIQKLPRLSSPFKPTPWLTNAYLQIAYLEFKRVLTRSLLYERVDQLTTSDNGQTALYWLGEGLAKDTPTLIVLHTIIGSPQSMHRFVSDMHALTGYRIVLCERRGHGTSKLKSAKFNTMGDTQDFAQQLEFIQSKYPDAPLFCAGVSAGTALLARYLGENRGNHPIQAAFMYSPGFDISLAFTRSDRLISWIMARKLLDHFVDSSGVHFDHLPSYGALKLSSDLHEFHQRMYECAGFSSSDEYFEQCNPVHHIDKVDIPLLVLNSADDPVCHPQNVYDYADTIRKLPRTVVALTRRGSHCAHLSGLWPVAWSHHLAAEFFLNQLPDQTQR